MKRLYEDGAKVLAGPGSWPMIVIKATETLSGWLYELAFITSKGLPDKRRRKDHRNFLEKDIKPQ